eukprot:1346690-Prymnesium_polylepis.1
MPTSCAGCSRPSRRRRRLSSWHALSRVSAATPTSSRRSMRQVRIRRRRYARGTYSGQRGLTN